MSKICFIGSTEPDATMCYPEWNVAILGLLLLKDHVTIVLLTYYCMLDATEISGICDPGLSVLTVKLLHLRMF